MHMINMHVEHWRKHDGAVTDFAVLAGADVENINQIYQPRTRKFKFEFQISSHAPYVPMPTECDWWEAYLYVLYQCYVYHIVVSLCNYACLVFLHHEKVI